MTTLNVIETEKEATATIAEMAVLSFAGVPDLKDVSDKEIAAISKRRTDENLRLELCRPRSDADGQRCALVSTIRDNNDEEIWKSMLKFLHEGPEAVRALLGFLGTAEARLLVALATAAQEQPDEDPDGGEDIPEVAA